MRIILTLMIALPLWQFALAAESDYVEAHCTGQIEYVLPDRTRVDCLTADGLHAVEYDYGRKWAEGLTQALHYASHTGRRAGVVFIVVTNSDRYGVARARAIIAHCGLPIDVLEVLE